MFHHAGVLYKGSRASILRLRVGGLRFRVQGRVEGWGFRASLGKVPKFCEKFNTRGYLQLAMLICFLISQRLGSMLGEGGLIHGPFWGTLNPKPQTLILKEP